MGLLSGGTTCAHHGCRTETAIPPVHCPSVAPPRTAATAISLLKWLVSLRDSSGDENIFLARFLQVTWRGGEVDVDSSKYAFGNMLFISV